MINLNTCVKGQKLLLRNGKVVTYVQDDWSEYYPHETRTESEDCLSYTDEGSYHSDGTISGFDVVEILPLETTDSPKLDKHPSVTWWESCPWITDRLPTALDGDTYNRVYSKCGEGRVLTSKWSDVSVDEKWIHLCGWKPPALTDKEQALQLINNHEDEDGWRPTPEQWNVIRAGLKAL